jgi:hypothetical protein
LVRLGRQDSRREGSPQTDYCNKRGNVSADGLHDGFKFRRHHEGIVTDWPCFVGVIASEGLAGSSFKGGMSSVK